jgi:hypothetical protein
MYGSSYDEVLLEWPVIILGARGIGLGVLFIELGCVLRVSGGAEACVGGENAAFGVILVCLL